MSKLIYVYGDDKALTDVLVTALRASGYSLEYASVEDKARAGNIQADIAFICRTVSDGNQLTYGDITVNFDSLSVTTSTGESIHLTPTEFALLSYLIQNATRAVSRTELLSKVWQYTGDSGTRVTDDTVKRLRKKLQDTEVNVETVWGYGFKIRA